MGSIESQNFSIVIPCFRGEDALKTLVDEICALALVPAQILLIWDGGSAGCWSECKKLSLRHEQVHAVSLARNFGQHNATICGFSLLDNVDWVVTMDEDGQHRPEDILLLLNAADDNTDVVYGVYDLPKFGIVRRVLSRSLQAALRVAIPKLPAEYSSFRLIRVDLAREMMGFSNSYTFLDGYLTWCTNNFKSVLVHHVESGESRSSYSKSALFIHALNIFVTFSAYPLRLITFLGSVSSIFGLVFGTVALCEKLLRPGSILPGYTTGLVLGCLGFGSVLFSLGVISEYVFRINEKTSGRPKYRIRD